MITLSTAWQVLLRPAVSQGVKIGELEPERLQKAKSLSRIQAKHPAQMANRAEQPIVVTLY